jgi:20S proteasome alpha/beta subunit
MAELRHKRRITVAAASKILANLTYTYKGMGLSMGTMVAGVRVVNLHLSTEIQLTPVFFR